VILAVEILRCVRDEEQKLLAMSEPGNLVSELSRFLPYSTHAVAMFVGEELFRDVGPERLSREHGALLAAFRASADEYYLRGMLKVRLLLAREGLDEQRASLQRLAGAFRGGLMFEGVRSVLDMVDEWDELITQQRSTSSDEPEPLGGDDQHEAPPESATSKHVAMMAQRFRDVFRQWAALRLRTNEPLP
jgi:hypothetical protein